MQRSTRGLVGLLLVVAAGCKPGTAEPPRVPAPSATAAVAAARPALHPCELLADGDVSRVVAAAKPGQRDDADEASGISTCRWAVGDGSITLQLFSAGPGALPRELRATSLEIVDLERPDAAAAVRLERFDGIGDLSGGFVERADAGRGIRRSNAVMMVQRGDRLAVLRIPQLANGERDAGLAVLKDLAGGIATGL